MGGRSNPFSAGPTLICLPPGTSYRFTALTATLDMAVSLTPADAGLPVAVIGPNDIPENRAGAANWSRTIRPGTSVAPTTRRLMMAETIVPPGNWTSYPPHKHDVENPPNEAIYEEVYFYLFKPAGGYGFQRVYEPGDAPDRLNEVYVVEDGDAVAIPTRLSSARGRGRLSACLHLGPVRRESYVRRVERRSCPRLDSRR